MPWPFSRSKKAAQTEPEPGLEDPPVESTHSTLLTANRQQAFRPPDQVQERQENQRDAQTRQRLEQLRQMGRGAASDVQRRHTMMTEQEETNNADVIGGKKVRHKSMFPGRKGKEKALQQVGVSRPDAIKKVPYRIKGEKFVVFDYYQPVRILGHGAYAVVCEAVDLRNGQKVAIKKNKGVFQDLSDAKRILREVKLLSHFHHDDVIKLLDVIPPDESEINTFDDVYLVMPRMETNLARVIKSSQKLTKRHIQFFLYQMLRGMKYIHSAGVIHRDLKPENILINGADCNLKITDFGLSRGVCLDPKAYTEYVVTRWYRAPEVMCSAKQYDEKVDMWAIGCILAELLNRKPLFPGSNHIEQLKIIFKVLGTPDQDNLDWVKTPEARRWIEGMRHHPGKDLNALFRDADPEILDICISMLLLDPDQRIDTEQGLEHPALAELHNVQKEITCPAFNTSFEFENSINTIFGVRHMMFEEFTRFSRNADLKRQNRATKMAPQQQANAEQMQEENPQPKRPAQPAPEEMDSIAE